MIAAIDISIKKSFQNIDKNINIYDLRARMAIKPCNNKIT